MRRTLFYFAFGSNMLTTRLQRRCSSARVRALAAAPGYEVAFDKLSEDTSGKANLVPGGPGSKALGVVYEISAADARGLDAVEGPGYRRRDRFAVTCLQTGDSLPALTYVARRNVPGLQPYDWYLALVLAGLIEHGFDDGYIRRFRAAGYVVDEEASRRVRLNALRDLLDAGYPDYGSLLRSDA